MAVTEVAVDGNVEVLLSEIDRILCSESITAKDVADAAVALAYLQAKGDRL
jgi:alpha-D-ribose 1-methylphosphonate 5-triphosphate synthase subunit PhnI